jgi:predicted patatin/cPLA2 family phospholipase
MGERELTAIVCSGGGMRSSHGAGFLYALATKLGMVAPDVMVCSSGDGATTLYFCSGQYESIKRIWTELLSTPKFISPLRFWRVMDIDYLVDTVCKNQEPLDTDKLGSSAIRWFVPIEDFDTGRARYVSAKDGLDPFEIMRATTAIPIFFGQKVPIVGKRYVDGELGPILQDHITQALRQGVKRILVVNHTSPWTAVSRAILRGYAAHAPQGMHDAIIRDISTNVFAMKASGAHVIAVVPQNLPAWTFTRDQKKLQQTFDVGVADALAHEVELRSLFSV